MQKDHHLKVAECRHVHGIAGSFVLKLLGKEGLSLKKGIEVLIVTSNERVVKEIEEVRGADKKLIKFVDISDRNSAEDLVPFTIYMDSKDLRPLKKGEYYHFEVVDLEAYSEDGQHIGKVKDLYDFGAQSNLLIIKKNGEELDIPLIENFVMSIDKVAKKMVLRLPIYIEENE